MEGHCSTGQSPQWAVVPMEEEGGIVLLSQSSELCSCLSVASRKVLCLLCVVCDYLVVVLKQLCIYIKFDSHCVKLQCKWLNFSKQLPVTAVWEEHMLLSFSFYSDLGNVSLTVKIQATPPNVVQTKNVLDIHKI